MQTKGRKLLGKLGGSREEGGTERGERGVCLFLRMGGGGGGGEEGRGKEGEMEEKILQDSCHLGCTDPISLVTQ